MTITIQGAPAEEEEESFYVDFSVPPECEAEYTDGTKCIKVAVYRVMTSCCRAQFLLCEDCLFEFIEYATRHDGQIYECAACDEPVVLSVNHLKVVGRIN